MAVNRQSGRGINTASLLGAYLDGVQRRMDAHEDTIETSEEFFEVMGRAFKEEQEAWSAKINLALYGE